MHSLLVAHLNWFREPHDARDVAAKFTTLAPVPTEVVTGKLTFITSRCVGDVSGERATPDSGSGFVVDVPTHMSGASGDSSGSDAHTEASIVSSASTSKKKPHFSSASVYITEGQSLLNINAKHHAHQL